MRDDLIEAEHKKYKEFIKKHNLKVGSVIKIREQGHLGGIIKEVKIAYINPHYGWFGTNEHPIKPEDVVLDSMEADQLEAPHEKVKDDPVA